MADTKRVILHDPATDLDFNINTAGQIEVTIEGGLSAYSISDIDDDATPNYYGFLASDGSWYILKETLATGDNSYRYVKGASGYNWSNRTSESYDTYDAVF